jgi:hypothetical protein
VRLRPSFFFAERYVRPSSRTEVTVAKEEEEEEEVAKDDG